MKLSEHIIIEMYGVKKRVGDIKSIFQSLERHNHSSLISTNNCIVFIYSWGHIIIYTSPKDKMLAIEILSSLGAYHNEKMKANILNIFQPQKYDVQETTRPLGNM